MLNQSIKKLVFIVLLIITFYLFLLIIPIIKPFLLIILNIFLPFLIAFVLTFVLYPIVLFIQKIVKKRILAVIITLLLVLIVLFFFSKYVFTIIIEELDVLQNRIPDLINELENIINTIIKKIPFIKMETINIDKDLFFSKEMINNFINESQMIKSIVNVIKYIIIVPIIVVYLLIDYDKILCHFRSYLVKNNFIRFKNYLSDLNQTMTKYVRGVLLVMLILFVVFSLVFMIIDLDNALIFALVIAICNVIPYLGSYIGTSLPVLYALLYSPTKAIVVLIICIVLQALESDFLTPYIQGKQMQLHPLVVMGALLLFGALFGFFGMIFAVPMASIIKITLSHYPIHKSKNLEN